VHLGAGDQWDGGERGLQQACILDDQAIGAEVVETAGERDRFLQLVIVQQGVEGDIDPGPAAVGVTGEGFDLL